MPNSQPDSEGKQPDETSSDDLAKNNRIPGQLGGDLPEDTMILAVEGLESRLEKIEKLSENDPQEKRKKVKELSELLILIQLKEGNLKARRLGSKAKKQALGDLEKLNNLVHQRIQELNKAITSQTRRFENIGKFNELVKLEFERINNLPENAKKFEQISSFIEYIQQMIKDKQFTAEELSVALHEANILRVTIKHDIAEDELREILRMEDREENFLKIMEALEKLIEKFAADPELESYFQEAQEMKAGAEKEKAETVERENQLKRELASLRGQLHHDSFELQAAKGDQKKQEELLANMIKIIQTAIFDEKGRIDHQRVLLFRKTTADNETSPHPMNAILIEIVKKLGNKQVNPYQVADLLQQDTVNQILSGVEPRRSAHDLRIEFEERLKMVNFIRDPGLALDEINCILADIESQLAKNHSFAANYSEKLLEKAKLKKKNAIRDVKKQLTELSGLAPNDQIEDLVEALEKGDELDGGTKELLKNFHIKLSAADSSSARETQRTFPRLRKTIKVLLSCFSVIVVLTALASYLEWKYDYLPPATRAEIDSRIAQARDDVQNRAFRVIFDHLPFPEADTSSEPEVVPQPGPEPLPDDHEQTEQLRLAAEAMAQACIAQINSAQNTEEIDGIILGLKQSAANNSFLTDKINEIQKTADDKKVRISDDEKQKVAADNVQKTIEKINLANSLEELAEISENFTKASDVDGLMKKYAKEVEQLRKVREEQLRIAIESLAKAEADAKEKVDQYVTAINSAPNSEFIEEILKQFRESAQANQLLSKYQEAVQNSAAGRLQNLKATAEAQERAEAEARAEAAAQEKYETYRQQVEATSDIKKLSELEIKIRQDAENDQLFLKRIPQLEGNISQRLQVLSEQRCNYYLEAINTCIDRKELERLGEAAILEAQQDWSTPNVLCRKILAAIRAQNNKILQAHEAACALERSKLRTAYEEQLTASRNKIAEFQEKTTEIQELMHRWEKVQDPELQERKVKNLTIGREEISKLTDETNFEEIQSAALELVASIADDQLPERFQSIANEIDARKARIEQTRTEITRWESYQAVRETEVERRRINIETGQKKIERLTREMQIHTAAQRLIEDLLGAGRNK